MAKMFFAGMPTSIDIKKLLDAYPSLAVGDIINHDDVAGVIGSNKESNRYRTVTSAWRRKMLDQGMEMGALVGIGFKVLSDEERVSGGFRNMQQGIRKVGRAVKKAVVVQTKDEMLIKKQEIMRRFGMLVIQESNQAMRQIEPPKAVSGLPPRRQAE